EAEPGGRQYQPVPPVSLGWRGGALAAAFFSRAQRPPPQGGRRGHERVTTGRVASRTIALARWTMTTHGGRTSLTVMAPRRTCMTRRTAAKLAGPRRAGSARCRRQATRATAKT